MKIQTTHLLTATVVILSIGFICIRMANAGTCTKLNKETCPKKAKPSKEVNLPENDKNGWKSLYTCTSDVAGNHRACTIKNSPNGRWFYVKGFK